LIFEFGGESFSAIKKNQGNYHKYAGKLLKDRPVDLVGELERGHGRFEIRDITMVAVDIEVSPFPHIAQIIKCTRIYRSTEEGAESEMSVRLFGTSHEYGSKTAAQIGKNHQNCTPLPRIGQPSKRPAPQGDQFIPTSKTFW